MLSFEEAKKREDYLFKLCGIENVIEDIRKGWLDNFDEDGVGLLGAAMLQIGYVYVEVNIFSEAQVSRDPNCHSKTTDIGYFVCANTGAKDGANTDGWYNLGYIEDRTVNVDWESESWQELLERDMFEALKEYVEKNNLHFDMPNPELPFPEVVSETNQNYIKKEDPHQYVFTITYNFDPESVAKLCKTHEEAVRRLREYLEAEINTIKTEQDYDPSILEWSEDDVVFVYAAGYEKGDDRNYALEDCAYYRIFEL